MERLENEIMATKFHLNELSKLNEVEQLVYLEKIHYNELYLKVGERKKILGNSYFYEILKSSRSLKGLEPYDPVQKRLIIESIEMGIKTENIDCRLEMVYLNTKYKNFTNILVADNIAILEKIESYKHINTSLTYYDMFKSKLYNFGDSEFENAFEMAKIEFLHELEADIAMNEQLR
jgi:hypothetical protein